MDEELLGAIPDEQSVDFVSYDTIKLLKKREYVSNQYSREVEAITSLMDDELLHVLEDVGAFIAGGALTSVFSNKEVNDIDVYLPNAAAFTHVLRTLYGETNEDDKYTAGFNGGRVSFYTGKSLTVMSNGVKVQLIVFRWQETAQSIFDYFDFTVNMCAINLASKELTMHPDFLKHVAQRYLSFNTGTAFPLMSALRVDKYRQKGYTISKSQMLRIMMAINNKNIDTWDKLCDELGGMYGLDAKKLFDTNKEFNMEDAMYQLENVEVDSKKNLFPSRDYDFTSVLEFFKDKVDKNYYNWRMTEGNQFKWNKDYKPYDETITYPEPVKATATENEQFLPAMPAWDITELPPAAMAAPYIHVMDEDGFKVVPPMKPPVAVSLTRNVS